MGTCIALTPAVQADPLDGRLKRIKETNTFVIAYRETGLPFSYLEKKDKPVGYAVDISLKVAEALKQKLNAPDLRIRWNPVTAATRIPLVTTSTVDIECGQTTNTTSRQKQVAFSNTFYVSEEGIATPAGSTINNLKDLNGKRVAVAANTTTEAALRARNQPGESQINIMPLRSNAIAMRALADGKVDAFVAATPILAGMIASEANPERLRITASGGEKEAFACMLPKDDDAFKKVVDDALASLMASGEMARLYDKWFNTAIPPRGTNLHLPLNEATRQVFTTPNDRAIQ